jgi:hypothetical protein
MGPSAPAEALGVPVEFSYGDASKGFMTTPIYRAGSVPDEFLVIATPGNCQRHVQITMAWDEAENWVRVRVQGKGVLPQYPDIDRTEGVDFFPNKWWPEPEDFEDGQYLLWLIAAPEVATFYYDVNTLELLGSEYDFETPPIPAIPVDLPVFTAIPTPFFQPDENGDIDVVWEYDYDGLVRPDLPEQAHALGSFIPHSLCTTDPYRYDRSSSRPYVTARPASEAKSWREYLENGLVFDLTVEPQEYFMYPPASTNVGAYQGMVAIAGNVPKGWSLDFESFFGGIAPPIRPLPTAPGPGQACTDWFKPKRDRPLNICAGPPPASGEAEGGAQ